MSEGFPLFSTLTETTLSSSAVACLNANVRKGGPGKVTAVPVWFLQVDTGIGFLNLDKGQLGPRQSNSGCGHAGKNLAGEISSGCVPMAWAMWPWATRNAVCTRAAA